MPGMEYDGTSAWETVGRRDVAGLRDRANTREGEALEEKVIRTRMKGMTVVFYQRSNCGMVQVLLGWDKEIQLVQCRCNFQNKTRRRP